MYKEAVSGLLDRCVSLKVIDRDLKDKVLRDLSRNRIEAAKGLLSKVGGMVLDCKREIYLQDVVHYRGGKKVDWAGLVQAVEREHASSPEVMCLEKMKILRRLEFANGQMMRESGGLVVKKAGLSTAEVQRLNNIKLQHIEKLSAHLSSLREKSIVKLENKKKGGLECDTIMKRAVSPNTYQGGCEIKASGKEGFGGSLMIERKKSMAEFNKSVRMMNVKKNENKTEQVEAIERKIEEVHSASRDVVLVLKEKIDSIRRDNEMMEKLISNSMVQEVKLTIDYESKRNERLVEGIEELQREVEEMQKEIQEMKSNSAMKNDLFSRRDTKSSLLRRLSNSRLKAPRDSETSTGSPERPNKHRFDCCL